MRDLWITHFSHNVCGLRTSVTMSYPFSHAQPDPHVVSGDLVYCQAFGAKLVVLNAEVFKTLLPLRRGIVSGLGFKKSY